MQATSFGTTKWTQYIDAFSLPDKAVRVAPMAVASDGTTYVAGAYNTDVVLGTSIFQNTATSAFVAKYDTNGDVSWAVALKGAARVTSITTDNSGNVYVVGTFAKAVELIDPAGNTVETINGKANDDSRSSFFILKYDNNGTLKAHKTVIPTVKSDVASSGMYFDEADATYFQSNKVMWANNRLYFSATYTGVSTFDGKTLSGNYFLYAGFMYVNIARMGVYSVDPSNLGNLKEEVALTFDNDGAENQTRPESVNFTVADGKVYAAFVATGKVKLSTPNKTETFNFTEGGGKREHGFILSEVSASNTNNVTYRSDVTDVETNYNLLEAMTFDNNNLYVAGTFNQPAVFGVEKTFKGGSDAFVAAINRSNRRVSWVATSGYNEGEAKQKREVVTGLVVVDGKILLASYAEAIKDRKPVEALVYGVKSNGTMNKGNDSFVYGVANNSNQIVTSTVDGVSITYTAYQVDETTDVRSLTAQPSIVRNGDVFSFANVQDVQVYNLQGALLLNAKAVRSISVASLPKGVYMLKAGLAKQKFVK